MVVLLDTKRKQEGICSGFVGFNGSVQEFKECGVNGAVCENIDKFQIFVRHHLSFRGLCGQKRLNFGRINCEMLGDHRHGGDLLLEHVGILIAHLDQCRQECRCRFALRGG